MKAKTTVAIVVLSLVLAISGLGCVALSKKITPADIDRGAVKFAEKGGTAEPNEYTGWPSLDKAERLDAAVDNAHSNIDFSLRQQLEANDHEYTQVKKVTVASVAKGQKLEEAFFGPKGFLTLGLGMIGSGGLLGSIGAFVGLMRRKPGDWAPEDVDAALSDAGLDGKVKGAQIVEIVKGIENLKAVLPEGVWEANKGKVAEKMSDATKEAVAVAKANL